MQYDFLIPIFAIIFGTVLTGVVFWKIFDFLKAWVTRGSGGSVDQEKFDRLAKAFIQYRKENDKRLQNIEAIITRDDSVPASTKKQLSETKSHQTIEIDSETAEPDEEESSRRMPNMLNKNKQRSSS